MSEDAHFLMTTCQIGFEAALKAEIARRYPAFRFAYSRPGFVTFKLPEGESFPADYRLRAVFARGYAFSLGKVSGDDLEKRAEESWRLFGDRPVCRLHVWQRDQARRGHRGWEPGVTPEVLEAEEALLRHAPKGTELVDRELWRSELAGHGEPILDCILVEPNEWWIGYHRARGFSTRLPGGMLPLELPPQMVSRAWLKMEEGLQWSELPIQVGDRVAEIGSAPGGGSQALLSRGCEVLGIDPARMDPAVLLHPRFTHIRRRSNQVRRTTYRKVRWLTADMNVTPNYTLDVIEEIVKRPDVKIRGILLTLKLIQPEMASRVDEYLGRVREWGFPVVRARQLQFNRHEIALTASLPR